MVSALSTTNSIVLGTVGAVFIVFALVSSFVLPRRDPNFPGKGMRWYLPLAGAFFVLMMGTVLVFGVEEEHAGAEGEHATEPAGKRAGSETGGDVEAGKVVFMNNPCGTCHVLAAAGSEGTTGPNLDEARPDEALVHERVTNGKGAMPPFEGSLTEEQINDVSAFVAQSAGEEADEAAE
jgi:mono/diheme cytochrome c family protein